MVTFPVLSGGSRPVAVGGDFALARGAGRECVEVAVVADRLERRERVVERLHRDHAQPRRHVADDLAAVLLGGEEHRRAASRAPNSFCRMPPIGPTVPAASIVPALPATSRPPLSSPGVSMSMMPNANIMPALGPPTLSSWIVTWIGKT